MQATVTEHRSNVAVLHLRGELDADTAETLYAVLNGLLRRRVPRIVVNLAELRFCDSVGLGAFVTTYMAAADRGGWIRFAGPNAFLCRLIRTVGLTRYISVFDNVDEAVQGRALIG